jgi:simple sugar transport system ATP-binding protein
MTEAIGCAHVYKRFGEVIANRDVSLSVRRAEVHAVIGENGAGKSTLMRALYGLAPPDAGEVRIGGERVARPSVAESIRRGVGMVHQQFMLIPTLTVAENVVLGREPRRGPLIDLARATGELAALAGRFGIEDPDAWPHRRVGDMSVAEAQLVEILKVLWRGAEVLILDEPTAVLAPVEVEGLIRLLMGLVKQGTTVVLVTHKLDEVLALADRVTVLRKGEVVAALDVAQTNAVELARAMVGKDVVLSVERPPPEPQPDAARPPRLALERVSAARPDGTLALDGVDLAVRGGEILGVAGVEGNGQSELGDVAVGLLAPLAGRVLLDGADVTSQPVRRRHQRGLGHVPEDWARGLVPSFSVEDNVMLGREDAYVGPLDPTIDRARLRAHAREVIEGLDVRPPDPTAPAAALSGGNKQKVVVGRELRGAPHVLVCAQPTRGVDVGATARIHEALLARRAAGGALLLISADLDELLALSDRIAVMFRGRVVGTVDNAANRRSELRARIGQLMLGAASS